MSGEKERIPKSRRKSQVDAVTRYVKKNYDRIVLNLRKGEKQRWQESASERGFDSLSAFIRHCVEKEIDIDNSD